MASSAPSKTTSSSSTTMASFSSSSSKKITLKSSDDENFDIDEDAAMLSVTIKNMVEDVGDSETTIRIPNVTSEILRKVIDYCNKHATEEKLKPEPEPEPEPEQYLTLRSQGEVPDEDLNQWDKNFLDVDQDTLFDIMLAANYMNIKGLVDLTCQRVADMINGKTVEEIRETFHIENDYSPEQEAQVRKENKWAFDD